MELKPVSPTTKAPGQEFTGDVYVNPIHRGEDPSRMIVGLVRFTLGARTNWHSHALGQTLHMPHTNTRTPSRANDAAPQRIRSRRRREPSSHG
jgi:hypothetical protein